MKRSNLLCLAAVAAPFCLATMSKAAGPDLLCGVENVEDMIALPGDRWIIGSGMGDKMFEHGGLYLIDQKRNAVHKAALILSGTMIAQAPYDQCPAPPGDKFSAQGLGLTRNADGTSTLYVVNHGGRESVEVFRVTTAGAAPRLDWIGCVAAPVNTNPNAVSPRADGSFVMSTALDGELPVEVVDGVLALKKGVKMTDLRGAVYLWSRAKGWAKIPGSELPLNNGVELSKDGKWVYAVSWPDASVTRLPVDPAAGKARKVNLDFFPDNIRWTYDGKLAAAGQINTTPEQVDACNRTNDPHCAIDYRAAEIDPRTLAVKRLYDGKGTTQFGMATTALKTKQALWLGAARTQCVAKVPAGGR